MCDDSFIFALLDVSRGHPKYHCRNRIEDFVEKWAPIVAGISFFIGIVLFSGVAGVSVLCCKSDPNRKKFEDEFDEIKSEPEN